MATLFLVTAVLVTLGVFWPEPVAETASAPRTASCGDCGCDTGQEDDSEEGMVALCSECFGMRFQAYRTRGVK